MSKPTAAPTENNPSPGEFPIVGIGASTGGLDALKRFLQSIPSGSGMAYVFVHHSNPSSESFLPEILRPLSRIPLTEIRTECKPEPDHLYLAPSGYGLIAVEGVLRAEKRKEDGGRLKIIDLFFTSLAASYQSYAVGVILSGTLNDGIVGLGKIKSAGGVTLAQTSDSAAEPAMPENAVNAGVVDFVTTPEAMFSRIEGINRLFYLPGNHVPGLPKEEEEDIFKSILTVLRTRRGVDFNYYKPSTLKRRISRRIAMSRAQSSRDYLDLLRESNSELEALYNDLLISVTGFFRDPLTFDYLAKQVLPALIAQRNQGDTIRVWSAGCATGEEAYSLAICLMEALAEQAAGIKIQIFATDISEQNIAKARIGIYKKDETEGISAGRLSQYFTRLDGDFQINKTIRELCIFAQHNFLKDPPFSRVDLITCRNVLIYLEPVLQKKVFTTFHYALNENGLMVLGKSESIGSNTDLFKPVPGIDKLYIRIGSVGRFMRVASPRREELFLQADLSGNGEVRTGTDIFKKADEVILLRYASPGVLVNDQFDVIQFRGLTDPWLSPAPGKASFNVLRMAREGLAFELRNLLHLAKQKNIPVKKSGIQIKSGAGDYYTGIEVFPLPDLPEPHFLILFSTEEAAFVNQQEAAVSGLMEGQDARNLRISQLEKQLLQTREDMRSITEEQEAANEELQSANEELLSGSEELQTLNEELETSKEELQSTNEELTIVNHELIDRNEQLNNARRYSDSIVRTIRGPLLVLDRKMTVKTATEGFYKLFGLDEHLVESRNLFEIRTSVFDFGLFRVLMEKELTGKEEIEDYEVEYNYGLGKIQLIINARVEKINGQDLILLALEDITARRRVEEVVASLQKMNANLEHSNQELEQFAHVASHDLQEPLRKIMMFSKFIEEKDNETLPETKLYLQKIIHAGKRMEQLIKDLLTFSKVGDLSVDATEIDLNELVKDILVDFDNVLAEKSIRLSLGKLPVINGILPHLRQLFSNLISNALKFAAAGRPGMLDIQAELLDAATIRLHPLLKKDLTYYDIVVTDNGIGFDPAFGEKIFVLFQRLHSHSFIPGTGIGLALCRRIVHNHKGEIYAVSRENEGAKFHVILPVST